MTPAVAADHNKAAEEESVESMKERLDEMFAIGKRAYIVADFATAAEKLGEASELSVELYGEFAVETFNPHYYYGKTMLEMASMETGVFANALHNTPDAAGDGDSDSDSDGDGDGDDGDGDDEEKEEGKDKDTEPTEQNGKGTGKQPKEGPGKAEKEQPRSIVVENPKKLSEAEKEQIAEQVAEAIEQNAKALESGQFGADQLDDKTDEKGDHPSEAATEGDKGDKEESEAGAEAEGICKGNGQDMAEAEADGKKADKTDKADEDQGDSGVEDGQVNREEDGEEQEEAEVEEEEESVGDDVESIQLAWEALEVARTICDRHIEDEGWLEKKAEVLLALGQCSIQNADYKQATDDIDSSIELFKSCHLPGGDRRIAGAYFQKGRALRCDKQFEKAAEAYKTVKQLLEGVLAYHKKRIEEEEDKEKKEYAQKQIANIESLIPDIQSTIDDALESAKIAPEVEQQKEAETAANGSGHLKPGTSDTTTVRDISEMVRKKPAKRPLSAAAPADTNTDTDGELAKKAKSVESPENEEGSASEVKEAKANTVVV